MISLKTGDVANNMVTPDLLTADETGKSIIVVFVQERFVKKTTKFHGRLKTKSLHTFESMYTLEVDVKKEKPVGVKAERDLFKRVITDMEAGKDLGNGVTVLQSTLTYCPPASKLICFLTGTPGTQSKQQHGQREVKDGG